MTPEKRLTLGVILPHTKIFGGIKRFFEIGNILIANGHQFIVFTPDGIAPTWFPFRGLVFKLEELPWYSLDAIFITEPDFLANLYTTKTRLKIFYAILQRRYIRKIASRKDIIVLANSGALYEYLGGDKREKVFKCIGGIDLEKFVFRRKKPKQQGAPLVVLIYGRFYRRKKGTMLVVKACERLFRQGFNLQLLLFDTPVDEEARKKVEEFSCQVPFKFFIDYPVEDLPDLYYGADIFVSAERNAGWSNTCAEAMACGVPVIATKSGTKDFLFHGETGLVVLRHPWFIKRAIKKLYRDEDLRFTLSMNARKKIEGFSWKTVAMKIEQVIRTRMNGHE